VRVLLDRASLILGGAALACAVAIDFTSVVARHLGLSVLGAIEIIQFCIVAAISSALLSASLHGSHAAVHLLVTRVGPRMKLLLHRFSDLLTVALLIAVLTGSLWVLIELMHLDERSDLLRLPFAPARMLWCLSLALTAAVTAAGLIAAPQAELSEPEAALLDKQTDV
jgi:TRAP-type C4-dicarboxylate transport system permease small subunit